LDTASPSLVCFSVGSTVNFFGKDVPVTEDCVTVTKPVVAPVGTFAVMVVAVTAEPLTVSVGEEPKTTPVDAAGVKVPSILTVVPTTPCEGAKLVIVGGGTAAAGPAVTTRVAPVIAAQPATVATARKVDGMANPPRSGQINQQYGCG
jgi:hypothetical protein